MVAQFLYHRESNAGREDGGESDSIREDSGRGGVSARGD